MFVLWRAYCAQKRQSCSQSPDLAFIMLHNSNFEPVASFLILLAKEINSVSGRPKSEFICFLSIEDSLSICQLFYYIRFTISS